MRFRVPCASGRLSSIRDSNEYSVQQSMAAECAGVTATDGTGSGLEPALYSCLVDEGDRADKSHDATCRIVYRVQDATIFAQEP